MKFKKRFLKIKNKTICCLLKRDKRAKNITIKVTAENKILVTIPRMFFNFCYIDKLILDKIDWIEKRIEYNNNYVFGNFQEDKESALNLIEERIKHYNNFYNFEYNLIKIKNNSTRWGSCSSKGNLNFNFKLLYLPLHLTDYIIVHELCHLKEMNHSDRFWQLVSRAMPNYRSLRKELRKINIY